jgi:hypothetical protein
MTLPRGGGEALEGGGAWDLGIRNEGWSKKLGMRHEGGCLGVEDEA